MEPFLLVSQFGPDQVHFLLPRWSKWKAHAMRATEFTFYFGSSTYGAFFVSVTV